MKPIVLEGKPVEVGTRLYDGAGFLFHVRGFVDGQVIVRTWFRNKRWWDYRCVPAWSVKHYTRNPPPGPRGYDRA